jgi:hypothetical protein
MQDGEDEFMHEGGSEAPTPSNVAEKLVQQDIGKDGTENTDAFRERVADEIVQRELARREAREARKAEKALNKECARADGVKGTGPEGAPARVDPATAVAVVARPGNEASSKPKDVEEHVGEANGKAKRKRGYVSVAVEVREPRLAPTDSRQPLLPSRDVPPQLSVSGGGPGFPTPITVLTFSFLVSRERPKWTRGSLASTGQSLLAGTNLLHKPPGAARLAGTKGDLLPSQLWTTADAWQRTPSPVDCRPSHDDKKLLGFVAGALELIQERVLRV